VNDPQRKTAVLIADDSPSMRMLLSHVLNADPRIEVIGIVNDGEQALEFLTQHTRRPDVVLMDIHMPRLDGFEATRRIMETAPVPIVICTATADPKELAVTFRSMEAGAVACVEKPVGIDDADYPRLMRDLCQTIVLMAEVKVVRRWPKTRTTTGPIAHRVPAPRTHQQRMVGIGASTGGPPVLQTILAGLPTDFPAPILIVQHIAQGFLSGMVEWLNQTTGMRVQIAAHHAVPLAGHAYIAPDDFHLGLAASGRLVLAREPAESGLRPAVSWLFRSLAQNSGASAVGVLLTGMGRDGADELKHMRDRGATTIAQDRETSVVHGMPGEAIALGAASLILPADRIAGALIAEIGRRPTAVGGVDS
jgi:two-component system chemotaxis response regulator CheB